MNLRAHTLATLLCAAGLAPACVDPELGESVQEIMSVNGLGTQNGLRTQNGLGTQNGLSLSSGLSTQTGLVNGGPLMSSADGRTTAAYLVRCALPVGRSITKLDQYGTSYTFPGGLGVAPRWETGRCDGTCQAWVSACMIAHINTEGVSVPLWIVADASAQPQIGWALHPEYPNQEGSYFGNIFASPPTLGYCNGRDYQRRPVEGRLGDNDLEDPPYVNPWGPDAPCSQHCSTAPSPHESSGSVACTGGHSKVITVWRQ